MAFISPPEVLLRQSLKLRSCVKTFPQILGSSPCLAQGRTYRAAVCNKIGAPLDIEERKLPKELKPSEVLISTHAVGINFADILTVKGQYQSRPKTPFIPGMEVSGKVMEVGTDVKAVKPGDRVVTMSVMRSGFAEYLLTDAVTCFPVPDNLCLVDAAATSSSYGTAMMALERKAQLKEGEKVLVTAAAGGTGLAAVDIAKNIFNCEVIGVGGGPHKCAFLKSRGCDHTIDYSSERIQDRVKAITDGVGVDVAMDQVGGETLMECVKSLGWEGRALTIGYASGKIPEIPANRLLLKSAHLIGCYWGNYALANPLAFADSIIKVMNAVKENKIHPYVGKTFPLEQVNEAFQYILDRHSVGKVVIKMREEDDPI